MIVMKKTLAAVLAAAMALSTATVAFASDSADADLTLKPGTGKDNTATVSQKIGSEKKYNVEIIDFGDNHVSIGAADLGKMIDEGWVKVTVKVTSGRSYLASAPTVTEVGGIATLKVKFADTYKVNTIEPGTEKDPLKATIKVDVTFVKDVKWDGTKFNLTDGTILDGMKKGDTVHAGDVIIKSGYYETDDYGTDMTFTSTEVSNRETVIIAENLINEIGDEAVNIYFGDTAAFSAKIAATQKNLNVYYTIDEIDEIVDAYDDVEFEFITFKGTPSFSKAGTMTFNAIGGKNTTVYTYANGELTELDSEYDSTYGIVTVDGIKTLGTFVVASEALEVEEEPAAPSTPAVEEENPNTGAC